MLLGVISDTHGNTRRTLDAARMLETFDVEQIIHCGDVGGAAIPRLLPRPAHFVLGNVDRDEADLREAIETAGHHFHGRFGSLEVGGVKIAFLHGDDHRRLAETIASGEYRLVCYGHTHRAALHEEDGVIALNPGALHRANPPSLAVVDTRDMQITEVPL